MLISSITYDHNEHILCDPGGHDCIALASLVLELIVHNLRGRLHTNGHRGSGGLRQGMKYMK
jgi:hypothetical protein